jgi:hypothetical protein
MKASLSKLGISLRSSARDGALIVISILIAFFLDAWWDDQIEQREISDNLRAVYVDFSSTQDTKLISLELDDIERMDAAAKAELSYLLPRGGLTFDPVLGSVHALISSGQLNRVRNLEVRSLIAAWPALMDEIGEDQEILIDTYMAVQESNVDLGIYLTSLHGELGNHSLQADDEILAAVTQDVEMLNRLAAHRFAVQSLNEELSEVEEHLNHILRLLEQELGIENPK